MMKLRSVVAKVASSGNSLLKIDGPGKKTITPKYAILLAAFLCIFVPLDFCQLDFMLFGAAAYWFLSTLQPRLANKSRLHNKKVVASAEHSQKSKLPVLHAQAVTSKEVLT